LYPLRSIASRISVATDFGLGLAGGLDVLAAMKIQPGSTNAALNRVARPDTATTAQAQFSAPPGSRRIPREGGMTRIGLRVLA